MSRTIAPLALLCSVAVAACGGDSDQPTATAPPPAATVNYDQYGISFDTEPSWTVNGGLRPHISTVTSGAATAAIWQFPRRERLPRSAAELRRALSSLTAASERRDPSFRRIEGRTLRVDGRPAVEIRAVDRTGGKQRATRTIHVYAYGAEIVVDQFTTPTDFSRADRALFQPLIGALERSPQPVSRRAFVVVLDACGAGPLADSAQYGDEGADTLSHLAAAVGGLDLPVLGGLGLGCVRPIEGVPCGEEPALHGRLHPVSAGKDSATGHWELMGAIARDPLPTYSGGFPPEVIALLETTTGRRFLANVAIDGIAAIERYGEEHLSTGRPILYTSQDSVMQFAAHVDVMTPVELHELCGAARAAMTGEHAIGRVIARPFAGGPKTFHRTEGRRDFALPPPGRTYLDELFDDGAEVHAVGKIGDLFAARGISHLHKAATNAAGLAATEELVAELQSGLVFTNLVETDETFGHRKDVDGFHRALREIDAAVGEWIERLGADDMLVLTADHGCDPAAPHTDHTREHVPLLALFEGHGGRRHDGPMSDVGASVLRWLSGRSADLPGRSFVD